LRRARVGGDGGKCLGGCEDGDTCNDEINWHIGLRLGAQNWIWRVLKLLIDCRSRSRTFNTNNSTYRSAWARESYQVTGSTSDPPPNRFASSDFSAVSTLWVHAQHCNLLQFSGCTKRDIQRCPALPDHGYSYDPYGIRLQATAFSTDFGYAGMFYNADSDLYFTQYRVYDTVASR
jgi:hypothetical protein